MLRGNYKVYLNERQSDVLKEELGMGNKFVQVDDMFFKSEDISFVLPAAEIEREDHAKKGDWKCEYNFWHVRGEHCGHGDAARYQSQG